MGRTPTRKRGPAWVMGMILGLAVAAALTTWGRAPAAEKPDGRGRADGGAPRRMPDFKPLVPGQDAPDFQLPRLVLGTDPSGNTVGKVGSETVRLSAFRGTKPVCLFLSSYT